MATYNSFKRIASDSFVNNSIVANDLAATSVTNGKLAPNAVTQAKIATNAIGTTQLASTIDLSGKTVAYRAITTSDISGSAGIAASKLASGAAATNIGYTPLNNNGGTMTGTLTIPAGSSGTGGLNLSGETNTGLFFGSSTVGITVAGTQRGLIDSSGRFTKGNSDSNGQPAFVATGVNGWRYNNQASAGTGWQEIGNGFGWNAVYNRGNHFSNANGRWTVPVSGWYHLHWLTYSHNDNNEPPNYFHMSFSRNGNVNAWGRCPHGMYSHGTHNGPYASGVTMDLDVYLNSGEYTSVFFYWNSNNGRIHADHSFFAGYLIG